MTGDALSELRAWLAGYRPAWHADALCKEYPDVDFLPGRGTDTLQARSICARCLVREECRDAGIAGDEVGIWGGTTGRNRRTGNLDPVIGTAPARPAADRLRIALDMRADGRARAEIATALDCTPAAVTNLLWRHDTKHRGALAS
jgi:hypothetical protein